MDTRRFSIAQAKQQLPRLIHEVEASGPIELTRRGAPVAVLLSSRAYEGLLRDRPSLWESVARFRDQAELACHEDDDPWADVRDRSPGRPVAL